MRSGTSGKTVLVDFIQEVQVKSSGYNAEFGGATGGVINVITKSGSNAFRGSVGTYYTGQPLRGEVRPPGASTRGRTPAARSRATSSRCTAATTTAGTTGTRCSTSAAR